MTRERRGRASQQAISGEGYHQISGVMWDLGPVSHRDSPAHNIIMPQWVYVWQGRKIPEVWQEKCKWWRGEASSDGSRGIFPALQRHNISQGHIGGKSGTIKIAGVENGLQIFDGERLAERWVSKLGEP